jgi:hypothetical protein
LRRRSAIEPVIGHMKEDGRLGRNFLSNRHGDRLNAILAGVGQNVRLLLRWFQRLLLCLVLGWLYDALSLRRPRPARARPPQKRFFTDDYLCRPHQARSDAHGGWTASRSI